MSRRDHSNRKILNGEHTRKRLIRIGNRDHWLCQLCGGPIDPIGRHTEVSSRDPNRPSVDHIVPAWVGGSESDDNLRLAHQCCNEYICGHNTQPFQNFDRTPFMQPRPLNRHSYSRTSVHTGNTYLSTVI